MLRPNDYEAISKSRGIPVQPAKATAGNTHLSLFWVFLIFTLSLISMGLGGGVLPYGGNDGGGFFSSWQLH